MKLATFVHDGVEQPGVVVGDRIVPTASPPVAGRSTFGPGMVRRYSSWVALTTPSPHGV